MEANTLASEGEKWRRAYRIRAFEELLLRLFAEGRLQGTVHTCSGQEWSAIAVAAALRDDDRVLSNHRGHGHFLARRPELAGSLLAEIMGLASGLCGGVGGSQHLYADGFYSNGVQGGMTPVAAGLALAEKLRGGNGVVAVFVGDGTTGEGLLYEAMNLAAIWRLPLLFVLERNGYAQSTATVDTLAGDLRKRAEGFGLTFFKGGVWSPEALCAVASDAVKAVRTGTPALLEIECFRLNAHSKGDDNRPPDLVAAFREKDPLRVFLQRNPDVAQKYVMEAEEDLASLLAGIDGAACSFTPPPPIRPAPVAWRPAPADEAKRYGETLYLALRRFMEEEPGAVVMGEDVLPPYGGAFKITRDLGNRFPGRVLNTPISEAAITGVGTGLALAGMRPVVEIMFGDFLTLVFDQVQQHAAKFPAMSQGRLRVPLVVRTPSGGRRGYGPTHSQSLEKHFLGIPGLEVVALNSRLDPFPAFAGENSDGGPRLVIENKTVYPLLSPPPVPERYEALLSDEAFPVVRLRPSGCQADVTIACYGGMLEHVEAALAEAFLEDEVLCDILCYARLYPLNPTPLLESVERTRRLLTVEEGPGFAGWGAELAAQAAYAGIGMTRVRRLSYDGVIPSSAVREKELLPGCGDIRRALREMMES